MLNLDFIGLLVLIAGFIIGLGAVTVIDVHGVLGRSSGYWTEATTRTHKVTKPLIWVGILLAIVGGLIFFRNESFSGIPFYHTIIASGLILNGLFLSFYVSPFLIQREREGKQTELLPSTLQNKIIVSFVLSDLGWWGGLVLLVWYIIEKL
jgi:hypothetical protein